MKLHIHEVEIKENRFRAYTRDKAGKPLKKSIFLHSDDLWLKPTDWIYNGTVSTTGIKHDFIKELHRKLKEEGVVVVRMPPLIKHFFVFEGELDNADIRIYSKDKKLSRFYEYWNLLKLSPHGGKYEGTPPKYLGEIEITNYIVAKKLGLDFKQLQRDEFQIKVVRHTQYEESLERMMKRKLPESFPDLEKQFGIKISNFRIKVKPSDANSEKPQKKIHKSLHSEPQHITQTNENNHAMIENTKKGEAGNDIFNNWLVKLIGLIAAITGLLSFFLN